MQRVTISLDEDLVAEIDAFMMGRGYANRSEAKPISHARASRRQISMWQGAATALPHACCERRPDRKMHLGPQV
jgi:hypothetical protein